MHETILLINYFKKILKNKMSFWCFNKLFEVSNQTHHCAAELCSVVAVVLVSQF